MANLLCSGDSSGDGVEVRTFCGVVPFLRWALRVVTGIVEAIIPWCQVEEAGIGTWSTTEHDGSRSDSNTEDKLACNEKITNYVTSLYATEQLFADQLTVFGWGRGIGLTVGARRRG